MKNTYLAVLALLVVFGFGCQRAPEPVVEEGPVEIDRNTILLNAKESGLIMSDDEVGTMQSIELTETDGGSFGFTADVFDQDFSSWNSAALADVTGGEAFGIARSQFVNGQYTLLVEMGNIPPTAEDYFYEGWIVRRGAELSVISTGKAEVHEEGYVNVFRSPSDLTDHDFYVLTLEPDDGDPAPDEHILEGAF